MAVDDAPTTDKQASHTCGVKRRQSGSSPPAKKSKSAADVCDKAGPTVAPVSSTDGDDDLIITPPVLMTTIATPLPNNDWREMVLSVITEYSGEAVVNCIHNPTLVAEPEIAPHMLDNLLLMAAVCSMHYLKN